MDTIDDPSALDLAALAAPNMSPVLGRYMDRSWSHGIGHRLYDTAGREYLDFANGIAVTSLGHTHPRVTAAIHAQVDRLIGPVHAMGFSEPTVELARRLAATFPEPLDSVLFMNSGSEAIDGALKLARRTTGPARDHRVPRRLPRPDVRRDERHDVEHQLPDRLRAAPAGRVLRALSVRLRARGRRGGATASSLAILRSLLATIIAPSQVAAILIEPVQGEGGYTRRRSTSCAGCAHCATSTGSCSSPTRSSRASARTGEMWSFQHAGIVPDVVVTAKAIANGLPLSAISPARSSRRAGAAARTARPTAATRSPAPRASPCSRRSRPRGSSPTPRLRGAELSGGLRELMADFPAIGDVRGPGLMIGVEFVRDRTTREPDGATAEAVAARAADDGLLLLTCGIHHQVIRWIPPLDVTVSEVEEALGTFERALRG